MEKHLKSLTRDASCTLTFAEIEQILDAALPPSASRYQAWWANQRGPGHVQTRGWLDVGYHTSEVNLKGRHVTFVPVALPREPKGVRATRAGLSIDEAKLGLAKRYGVRSEAIEITLRG